METTEAYNYDLDESLIAQTPLLKRDESRMMIVDRKTNQINDDYFYNIINYLNEGDCLVINDSKVIPARLIGIKELTMAKVEVLLLKDLGNNIWECLCKPAKRLRKGMIVSFGDGLLRMECIKEKEEGIREFRLIYEGILMEILDQLGSMPLPPYIKETLKDKDRYQTIYAQNDGSAAAPTAGLHFTKEILNKIKERNIKIAKLTLHVGLGTFRPVSVTNIKEHQMHQEYYSLDSDNALIINKTIKNNGKIISVGTTSTRTLESIYQKYQEIKACSGYTDIFIYPGFEFKVIDAQLTNFHLPKSTLMMLVSAFASKELIMEAYQRAVDSRYRFFSFGDCMLII
ncbi:MAG: tRNA preQ1(34) S-adenosylmethionine ribosyltransferase-isomerase QueA [Bacilli bacterium]|jgi:S-adenosylmethionine:tRNA ribosyltransferase-isomerase|nr:tRNA preQ1(34) S-adenosylmethionine ribosyltransferase-isomerase QueA [Bacilli bacterium]